MTAADGMDAGPVLAVESLPRVVENLSRRYPNDVWMSFPLDSGFSSRWRHITYRELGNAVNGMHSWLDATLGDLIMPGKVVAYMGQVHSRQKRLCLTHTDLDLRQHQRHALRDSRGCLDRSRVYCKLHGHGRTVARRVTDVRRGFVAVTAQLFRRSAFAVHRRRLSCAATQRGC